MPNLSGSQPDPVVTVVVAAFNVAEYVDEALFSIRRQSLEAIEVLVVDDRSTDTTRACLSRHAGEDPRVRIIDGAGRGPAAARNLAIAQARGRWVAIIDADDVIAPDRLERMMAEAEGSSADAVADNMTAFYEGDPSRDHPWIDPAVWPGSRALSFDDLMTGGLGDPPAPELGYLKPMLRRDRLARLGKPYNDTLVIGEDFDLMARWTAAGFSYRYMAEAGYRYRRRVSSLSYRLSADQIDHMIGALDRLDTSAPGFNTGSVDRRRLALGQTQRYARRVDRLKRGDVTALAAILLDSDGRRRLSVSVREGLSRRLGALTRPD